MPVILHSEDTEIVHQGEGWRQIKLADAETFGSAAMLAYRWILEPDARGPDMALGEKDQLLYVIRGSGKAEVDGKSYPLAEESVLWLEPDEKYCFIAGENGLEILQGFAPGETS